MNLVIYVLLLSIWTTVQNDIVNTTQKNETSTKTNGTKQHETMQSKMEGFRKRLLIIVIGVIVTGFALVCFCFIHYACTGEEPPKTDKVKKYVVAPSHRSSKTSITGNKTPSSICEEKQPMLSSTDKLSEISSPEKSSIPSSTEKQIRTPNPEKASRPASAKILGKPPKQKMPCMQSKPDKGVRPTNFQGKSKGYSKGKSPHSHKMVSKVHPTYQSREVKTPLPVTLETRYKQKVSPRLPNPHSQYISSTIQKMTRSYIHGQTLSCRDKTHNGRTGPLDKSCDCHKEICRVCKISEFAVNGVLEAKCGHAPLSKKMYFSRSFQRIESKECVVLDKSSETDKTTVAHESNDDSDKEVTIFCNINCDDDILKLN